MSEALDPHSSSAAQAAPATPVVNKSFASISTVLATPETDSEAYTWGTASLSNSSTDAQVNVAHPGDFFGFETQPEPQNMTLSTNSLDTVEESASENEETKVEWAQPYKPAKVNVEYDDKVEGSITSTDEDDYVLPPHPFADDAEDPNPHLQSVNFIQLPGPVERRHYDHHKYIGSTWDTGYTRIVPLDNANYNPSTRPLLGSPKSILFDASDAISEFELATASFKVDVDAMSEYVLDDEVTWGDDAKDDVVLRLRAAREASFASQRYTKERASSSDFKDKSEMLYQLAAAPKSANENVDLSILDTEIWHNGQPKVTRPYKTHKYAIAEYPYKTAHWPGLDKPKPIWTAEKWWYKGWEKVGLVQYH